MLSVQKEAAKRTGGPPHPSRRSSKTTATETKAALRGPATFRRKSSSRLATQAWLRFWFGPSVSVPPTPLHPPWPGSP